MNSPGEEAVDESRPLGDREKEELRKRLASLQKAFDALQGTQYPGDYSIIDGHERNIEDLVAMDYDGRSQDLGKDLLESTFPLVVLNVMVCQQACRWVMVRCGQGWEYAVDHDLLPNPLSVSELCRGEWIENWDFDEPPELVELADESYDDIQRAFARARIFGSEKIRRPSRRDRP